MSTLAIVLVLAGTNLLLFSIGQVLHEIRDRLPSPKLGTEPKKEK